MGESRMDKGFTKVPNILLNSILKRQFTGVELKLIMVIIRYTSGFMRESAELSVAFLAKEIGSTKSVVSRHMARLVKIGVIKVCEINPYTKVRTLMINNDIETWGGDVAQKVAQENGFGVAHSVNSEIARLDNGEVAHLVNSEIAHSVNYVYTARSTNKDNINIILYKNKKERVNFSEKIDKSVTRWLEYKTERGETYTKTSLSALLNTISDKVRVWGEEEVVEVINDCIASGYKNIVWEKLKIRNARNNVRMEDEFINSYDHLALEKLSRGSEDDK